MTKNTSHLPLQKIKINQRLTGLLALVGVLLVLAIFSIFYWQKITAGEKLAKLLPADRTLAFLEFNLDPSRSETAELQKLLAQNPVVQAQFNYLISLAPHGDLFWQWFNGRGGVALLSNIQGQRIENVLFLQKTNQEKTLNWINELVLDPKNDVVLDEDYYGQKLISFRSGQTYNLMLTSDYLVLAENRDNLKLIAETIAGNHPRLREIPAYNQLISALPDQNILFLYLDRDKILSVLGRDNQFLAGRLANLKLYFPFLQLFSIEAIAIKLDHNQENKPVLSAKHLALFNQSKFPSPNLFATDYSYQGKLEYLLPEGAFFQAGGVNLLDQKNKLQAYFKNNSTVYDLLFSGAISGLRDTLQSPGKKIDLDQNFFPLFPQEYLLFAQMGEDKPELGLIFQSENTANDLLKLKPLLEAFGPKLSAIFDSQVSPITLPDGTEGSELKPELVAPSTSTITVKGKTVEKMSISSGYNLYIFADQQSKVILVTDTLSVLENVIGKTSASLKPNYGLDKPTEVYQLNLTLSPYATFLKPLTSIDIARKFTEIGLLSTYQLGF